MKKIAIAGVEFTPAVLDFNVLCVMEECGAPMNEWGKLDMSLLRGYLAACLDISAKQAGELIGAHVVEGGKLDERHSPRRQRKVIFSPPCGIGRPQQSRAKKNNQNRIRQSSARV